jgi:hypothetical protein
MQAHLTRGICRNLENLSTYQPINLSTYQPINLSTFSLIQPSLINLSTYQLINLFTINTNQVMSCLRQSLHTLDFLKSATTLTLYRVEIEYILFPFRSNLPY